MGSLDGRVAIITGAGGGWDVSTRCLFAAEGAKVVVNDLGDEADEVAEEIRGSGGEALASTDDITDLGGRRGARRRRAVDGFGGLDVLVNNAGILRDRMLVSMSEEEWDDVVDVHLKGHFVPTRFAAAYWREQVKAGRPCRRRSSTPRRPRACSATRARPTTAPPRPASVRSASSAPRSSAATACGPTASRRPPAPGSPRRRPGSATWSAAPTEGFDVWDPANVSPLVAYLATADCPITGRTFFAQGGTVRRARAVAAGRAHRARPTGGPIEDLGQGAAPTIVTLEPHRNRPPVALRPGCILTAARARLVGAVCWTWRSPAAAMRPPPQQVGQPEPVVGIEPAPRQSAVISWILAAISAGRRVRGARLHGHHLGHVALHLDLAGHEGLHPGLRVAVDEDGLGRGVVERDGEVGVLEVADVHLDLAARGVHVGLDGAVAERDVGDDLVHPHGVGGRRRLPGVLLADLLGRLEPLVGQERVLRPRRRLLQVRRLGRRHRSTVICSRVQEVGRRRTGALSRGDQRRRAQGRAMASSSAATRVHDVAGHEGGQLGQRQRDPAGAVEVGVVPDRTRPRRAPAASGPPVADRAVGLAGLDDADHVVDVLLGAPAQRRR